MIWFCVLLFVIVIGLIWFFNLKPLPKSEDNFFGQLLDDDGFSGTKFFKPANKIIDIFIQKEGSGLPTNEQKAFYKQVESQYETIIEKIVPLLEVEFKNEQPDFKIDDFKKEFFPTWITIPIPSNDNQEWEFAFNTIHDDSHTFIVCFMDFEPQSILIDG